MAWHCKKTGAYARDSEEAFDNAKEAWFIMQNLGWTLNAFCGVYGNMEYESGFNPWRWQSDDVLPSTGSPWTNHGYGLVQFTPGGKYINAPEAQALPTYGPSFSDREGSTTDGAAQIVYIDGYADYYPTDTYPLSYDEFKHTTMEAGEAAVVWLYNYERPNITPSEIEHRRAAGEFWWIKMQGISPPKPPKQKRGFKFIYYLKRRGFYGNPNARRF